MIVLNKILSTSVQGGIRWVKMRLFGNGDAAEVRQVSPYGIDSNPVDGMQAIYAATKGNGERVVVGYINKNVLAEKGEIRMYSTDENGELQAYVWCTADGNVQLNGSGDNVVRYTALNTAIQNDIVNFFTTELLAISTGISAGGGSYTPSPFTVDLSGAKVDNVEVGT